ncbi:MAG TPA: hypothetical protein VIY86_11970, partial [Pirellulaceae bacterium]
MRHLISLIVVLGLLGSAAFEVRGQATSQNTDSAPSPRKQIDDRYQLSRFRQGAGKASAKQDQERRARASRLGRTGKIIRVQHSAPPEDPPLPDALRLAQSDFLDDLLNEEADATGDAVEALEGELDTTLNDPAGAVPEVSPRRSTVRTPAATSVRGGMELRRPANTLNATNPSATTLAPGANPVDGTVPPVPPRRSNMANQPYTLGDILDDEDDQFDCLCEKEFCELMWQCNGGRCLSWHSRIQRRFWRTYDVIWRGQCGPAMYKN